MDEIIITKCFRRIFLHVYHNTKCQDPIQKGTRIIPTGELCITACCSGQLRNMKIG
jgi:hypothetical protein